MFTVTFCFMQPQPTTKTSDAGIVKKPSLYWCEAVQSKSGPKGLKTVSAQTDQSRVSRCSGCRRVKRCVRGKYIKKEDFTLLQTTFTAFTETLTAVPELSLGGRKGVRGKRCGYVCVKGRGELTN